VGKSRQLPLRLRHDKSVSAIALRPDGGAVLTGGHDRACQLWELPGGRLLWKKSFPGKVICLAFRGDGKLFASGCHDGTARVWTTATREPAGPPLRHAGSVEWVAFPPDGKALVTASRDGRLKKWDPYQGTLQWEVTVPGPIMDGMVDGGLSADGRTAVTVVRGRPLYLWDAVTGSPKESPVAHLCGAVQAAGLAPKGQWLAAAGTDHILRVWDLATGKTIGPALPHADSVFHIQFSPDGRQLATTCHDGFLRVWKIAAPLQGSPERIRLTVELAAERTLGPFGEVLELDAKALEQRRRRLELLGK
jgi:WD40 repeat protein